MGKISKNPSLPVADWMQENKQRLIDAKKDESMAHGFLADNGQWKPEQTIRIVTAFNAAKGGLPYDRSQISSQISALKKKYTAFKNLVDLSGFGWDDERQTVTAPANVWETYINSHPSSAKFREKTFPFYEDLEFIYTNTLATGSFSASTIDGATHVRRTRTHEGAAGPV